MADFNEHLTIALLDASPAETMTGVFVVDVLAGEPNAEAGVPTWIKVTPRGKFTARDGRNFDVDPETLVARFRADGIKVAVDIDHATVRKAQSGDAAPAVGWIEELEARADGLYGRVEWLDEGKRVLAARTHRYISPVFPSDDKGKAAWLHSAALVAVPAASMPAVASATPTHQETTMLNAIATKLGLAAQADENSCLSAITTLQARVDPAVHQEVLNQLSAKTTELETLAASVRKEKVDRLLEDALKAKKISPAQRASYETLCATDAGLAEVTKLLETLGAGLAASGLDDKQTPGGVATLSAEDRDVMKMMDLTEEQYRKANGLTAA